MKMIPWDPFRELETLSNRLNQYLVQPSARREAGEAMFADWTPAVDIEETAGEYLLKADLPDVKTYAKPNIWTDMDNFKAVVAKLPGLEQGLTDAVKKGEKPMILAAIGNLGKNGCGACHSTYRAKMPQQ